jgi:hypothetical protein
MKKYRYLKFCVFVSVMKNLSIIRLIIVISIFAVYGCKLNRTLTECSITKSLRATIKTKILSQVDSVYASGNEIKCRKFKSIVSAKCVNHTSLYLKARLELKVKNKCNDWEYFYFDDNFNLIKVVHELKEIN